MKNQRQKMLLRYAAVIALGNNATASEKKELETIEDQLHLSSETILRQATELALNNAGPRELSPSQKEKFRRGCEAFRAGLNDINAARKLH